VVVGGVVETVVGSGEGDEDGGVVVVVGTVVVASIT
jgi:hypothetical protein